MSQASFAGKLRHDSKRARLTEQLSPIPSSDWQNDVIGNGGWAAAGSMPPGQGGEWNGKSFTGRKGDAGGSSGLAP
jgi:hypothetical protein